LSSISWEKPFCDFCWRDPPATLCLPATLRVAMQAGEALRAGLCAGTNRKTFIVFFASFVGFCSKSFPD